MDLVKKIKFTDGESFLENLTAINARGVEVTNGCISLGLTNSVCA
jgi:hypothetical protein